MKCENCNCPLEFDGNFARTLCDLCEEEWGEEHDAQVEYLEEQERCCEKATGISAFKMWDIYGLRVGIDISFSVK